MSRRNLAEESFETFFMDSAIRGNRDARSFCAIELSYLVCWSHRRKCYADEKGHWEPAQQVSGSTEKMSPSEYLRDAGTGVSVDGGGSWFCPCSELGMGE